VSGMRQRASRDVAALLQRAMHLRRLIELADEHAQDPSPTPVTMPTGSATPHRERGSVACRESDDPDQDVGQLVAARVELCAQRLGLGICSRPPYRTVGVDLPAPRVDHE